MTPPPEPELIAESVRTGKRRLVRYDGRLWWRIYRVGGYDGYQTWTGERLPCGELARRLEKGRPDGY